MALFVLFVILFFPYATKKQKKKKKGKEKEKEKSPHKKKEFQLLNSYSLLPLGLH
jgi:hypothetical protein